MSKVKFSLLCGLLVIAANLIYLARYDFNFSIFIAAPQYLVDCSPEAFTHIQHFKEGGSDGVYNYLASQDPLQLHPGLIQKCASDELYFTKERILYHLLSWSAVLGQTQYLHYSMFFINLLMFFGIIFFSIRLAEFYDLDKWQMGVLILTPGIWQVFRFSLVDMVWLFTVMGMIYYFVSRQPKKLAVFILLSLLARSYSMGIVAALLYQEWKDRGLKGMLWPYIVSLGLFYGVFKAWLLKKTTAAPVLFNGESEITWPFKTFFNQFSLALENHQWFAVFSSMAMCLFLVYMCVLVLSLIINSKKISYELIIAGGFPALIFFISSAAWTNALVQLPRILGPSLMVLLFALKRDSPRQLRFYIPFIYAISCVGLIWYVFSKKIELIS